nr:hypothetical protein BDOA9_0113200 [Bradyrhizobium sp. DOA9]
MLPSAQAQVSAGPAEPLREGAAEGVESVEPQAAAGQRDARQEAAVAVSGRAAVGPRPAAAKAASEQQAAAGARRRRTGCRG